jgi:hypothetical protein
MQGHFGEGLSEQVKGVPQFAAKDTMTQRGSIWATGRK